MNDSIVTAELSALASDVRFLARHALCPERQRGQLIEWSQELFQGEQKAVEHKKLSEVVDALVTISHANAVFGRSAAPPFYRGQPAIDIKDTGGYFAARTAITAIIRFLPLSEERMRRLRPIDFCGSGALIQRRVSF